MLNLKFIVLQTPISMKPEKADIIILALCVLHNFIRIHDDIFSTSQQPNIIQQIDVQNMQIQNNCTKFKASTVQIFL